MGGTVHPVAAAAEIVGGEAVDLWHRLIGRPLKVNEAAHEEITESEGLAALSLDALTSVAYGPQAILLVLAASGAIGLILPITAAIVVLLALLVLSYSQVIGAYPGGGGAYAVSRENLGVGWSKLAAASLIVDYVLTVAVSIAAGVATLASAFPALLPHTTLLCLAVLTLITVLNLRGVGESARAFLLPTVVFIVGLLAILAVGLVHPAAGAAPSAAAAVLPRTIGLLLLLKAFSAGCSALTGVEAIANGVPLFREPRVARARRTEALLGTILAAMLLGLAVLARRYAVVPHAGATVLSEIMVLAVGRGWLYYTVSVAVTTTLALAANTSFGGLPVLASLLARDRYLPHVFALRGDRLVFQHGVWVLAVLAGLLLIAVHGNTDALIPLFAIGVFIGFTLSQSGLALRWVRTRSRLWGLRTLLNGTGAAATGLAALIFLFTKFREGAWVVVIAIPVFIGLFGRIRRYYDRVRTELRVGESPPLAEPQRTLVIVPVGAVSRLAAEAVATARSFGDEVVVVSVVFAEPDGGPGEGESEIERQWAVWQPGVRLVTLRSQYHSIIRPLLRFVHSVDRRVHGRVMVLIPQVVPRKPWQYLLHDQLGLILAAHLRSRDDVVVGILPYRLGEDPEPRPQMDAVR